MEEDNIEKIEKTILKCNECKLKECIGCEYTFNDLQPLRYLLKRYKELEEENRGNKKQIHNLEIENGRLRIENKTIKETEPNSIPTSVIQNKLQKLKREFDFYAGREHFEWQDGEFDGEVCDDIALKIGVLKELLEEGRK